MLEDLKQYYTGFTISGARGNNAFSYEKRVNKFIFVPPIKAGGAHELSVSDEIAFSEIVDGKEVNPCGIKEFIYYIRQEPVRGEESQEKKILRPFGPQDDDDKKTVIIFDNHNHAFFFWCAAFNHGLIKKESVLAHVDQHSDMRSPSFGLSFDNEGKIDLQNAFDYTQYTLNVGCFIKPALDLGFFSKVEMFQNSEDFEKALPEKFVLDVDMDIFAPAMDYIPKDKKIAVIKALIAKATLITIATSPFFMEQEEAIEIIKEIVSS